MVGYAPQISREDYTRWNEFSLQNQDWIIEANTALDSKERELLLIDHDYLTHHSIHDLENVMDDGEIVKAGYDFATCTVQGYDGNGEWDLSDLKSQTVKYRRVPVQPSQYPKSYVSKQE
jgi:hypothetical protein